MRVQFKNILCTTDFSDFSNYAVPYGIALAKEFGAKLYLCHVIDMTPVAGYEHGAADFIENGFNQGYRVGFVYIQFPQSAHAIVCLNTTDNDLIFIEPQDDNILTELTIGEPYWDRDRYIVDYDDTIQLFEIIW